MRKELLLLEATTPPKAQRSAGGGGGGDTIQTGRGSAGKGGEWDGAKGCGTKARRSMLCSAPSGESSRSLCGTGADRRPAGTGRRGLERWPEAVLPNATCESSRAVGAAHEGVISCGVMHEHMSRHPRTTAFYSTCSMERGHVDAIAGASKRMTC